MERDEKRAVLHIYGFGPFREAHVELAPLTVFIGKNSLGKSMLLYLAWILETTSPDPGAMIRHLGGYDELHRILHRIFEEAERKRVEKKDLGDILDIAQAAVEHGLSVAFKERLTHVFGVRLQDLIHADAKRCEMRLEGPEASIRITIDGEDLSAKLEEAKEAEVVLGLLVLSIAIPIVKSILTILKPSARGIEESFLLVDGRAGITRVLLTSSPGVLLRLKDAPASDMEFMDSLFSMARDYMRGEIDTDAPVLGLLLRELGFEPLVVEELGIPRIYVKPWLGPRLPLERAPSGVRELLPAVLALLDRNRPLIYIEEPEAHLHPRAIRLVPRLMAYAINRLGKCVRITTHSDILVSQVNNLIAMSADPEGARELGYEPSELLRPEQVRAYWLRRAEDGNYVEVVELPVSETGFDEVEFAEVAEDLFIERGEVYRLLEAKKKGVA